MNLCITFILCFACCPFALAIFYPIPPFYFGDLFPLHYHHQHQHQQQHHHQSHSHQSHHSSSTSINIGSSKAKTTNQASKSEESRFFIAWVYKFAATVSISKGKYQSSSSIGIGIGHGHSVNGGGKSNQINNGSNHGGNKQNPSGHNGRPVQEKDYPWAIDHNSYVTEQSIHRPVTHIITTAKPFPPTTKAITTTSRPIKVITTTSKPITTTTTEEPIILPKPTTIKPAQPESNQKEQSSNESSSHSSVNDDVAGAVNHIIESIGSQAQAQALPCSPEQLILIKTGPVNIEKNTDAATGSTSIIVKPIIVVAPISVASNCGSNCESLQKTKDN